MLIRLTRWELVKIAAKPRSYIGFLAILAVVSIVQLAMYVDGKAYLDFITQSVEQSFYFEGNLLNGNLIALIIFSMLILQVPLLVALVTGDLVSGEAAGGTLRLLLTRPVSRTNLLTAKFIAGSVYTLILLVWLGILALGVGRMVFGEGDLVVLRSDGFVVLTQDDVLWRFWAALGVAYLAMLLIGSLSLMFSCFTDNSIGPIITTMAIILIFTIIGTLELPLIDRVKPFLFTTHMIVWKNFFDNPLPTGVILDSTLVMTGHIAIFLTIALMYFRRKDILS